jgi:hypothetical protein
MVLSGSQYNSVAASGEHGKEPLAPVPFEELLYQPSDYHRLK